MIREKYKIENSWITITSRHSYGAGNWEKVRNVWNIFSEHMYIKVDDGRKTLFLKER